jgi:hypothetical protein
MLNEERLTLPSGAPETLTDLSGLTEAEAEEQIINGFLQ